MISVIFLRGQTCETRKKRFLHFSDVENARNILLCNNRFMVSKYATSTLKTKYFTSDLFPETFIRILNPFDFRIFKRGDTRIDRKIASKKGTKIDAASFKPDTMIVKEAATTKNLNKLEFLNVIKGYI